MKQAGIMMVGLFYAGAGGSISSIVVDLLHGHWREALRWGPLGFALVLNLALLPCLYRIWKQLKVEPEPEIPDQSRFERMARAAVFGPAITNRIAFMVFGVCYVIGLVLPFAVGDSGVVR